MTERKPQMKSLEERAAEARIAAELVNARGEHKADDSEKSKSHESEGR